MRNREWIDRAQLILLIAGWAGIWGVWISHPTVALTQNALDLAEWATFLSDVRYGGLRLMPELLRLGIALAVLALAVAAGTINRWPVRWSLRLIAAVPGLVMLPPYPFILNPIGSGYEWRLAAALVLWVGICLMLLTDQLGWRGQRWLVLALSFLAAIAGWRGYLTLRGPFSAHYNHMLWLGWGAIVFGLGLAAAGGLAGYSLLVVRRE